MTSNPFFESIGQAISAAHEQREKQMMQMHASSLELESFIDRLNADDLFTLANLMGAIADSGDKTVATANYHEGWLRGILKEKYHVCPWHNIDHDADELRSMAEEAAAEGNEDWLDEFDGIDRQLKQYNVGIVNDIEVGPFTDFAEVAKSEPVTCVLCGYGYSSLVDRMLKPADSCPGCQDKAAHG